MTTIAIYGSAMPRPGDIIYEETRRLGYMLAQAGYAVMTGGYNGLMAAASHGANEAGGHVIGVTCIPLERARGSKVNPWVKEIVACESLHERVFELVGRADAFVVMPGGLGTLNELVYTCEMMRAGDAPRRPVICYGNFWNDIIHDPNITDYMHSDGWGDLHFSASPEAILAALKTHA